VTVRLLAWKWCSGNCHPPKRSSRRLSHSPSRFRGNSRPSTKRPNQRFPTHNTSWPDPKQGPGRARQVDIQSASLGIQGGNLSFERDFLSMLLRATPASVGGCFGARTRRKMRPPKKTPSRRSHATIFTAEGAPVLVIRILSMSRARCVKRPRFFKLNCSITSSCATRNPIHKGADFSPSGRLVISKLNGPCGGCFLLQKHPAARTFSAVIQETRLPNSR
jgi:hypothetical protein